MDKNITLRPHHLLCMNFFVGKGYSENFICNMTKIVEYLRSNEDTLVNLVSSNDDICSSCPNIIDGRCTTYDMVNRFDNNILKLCNLKLSEYTYSYLKHCIQANVLDKNLVNFVCGECSWNCGGNSNDNS